MFIEAFVIVVKDEEVVVQFKVWLLKNKQINYWEIIKAMVSVVYVMFCFGENWLVYDEFVQVFFFKLDVEAYEV